MNEYKDLLNTNKIGFCEKNSAGAVLYQNKTCILICGKKKGARCTFGCMKNMCDDLCADEYGFSLHKNIFEEKSINVDAVKIRTPNKIFTFLYDKTPFIISVLIELKKNHLTKTEEVIAKLILAGKNNSDIANLLNVSKKTIHTHLNNLYKKIPENLKLTKIRNRNKS